MKIRTPATLSALLLATAVSAANADPLPPVAESSNMQLIGHSNLNGAGEQRPVPLAVMPPQADMTPLCKAGGRFGAHNIAQNQQGQPVRVLKNTVVGGFFAGGVRAYSIANANAPVEIGYLVDAAPPGNATHTIQINDVYVDDHGLIYANDRFTGGLDIIKYTGSVPLD
ncbi:MAG TPA: hypothetical protein VGG99_13700 [Acetobacteraceae bacterium]|jgi:hypothetical protein